MSAISFRRTCLGVTAVACAVLAGCGSLDGMTRNFAGSLAPYKVEVVQGNFVSKEQVDALKPGMTRLQVRDILGTPLLTSVFHADRWDYVFTLKRPGAESQLRKFAVFFKGDVLERSEGDAMPSEAEFVARLDSRRKTAKVPVLEASEESLKAFAAKPDAEPATVVPVATAPVPVTYPPLEAPAR
jgi:outer membrane protein assembly factor BamE